MRTRPWIGGEKGGRGLRSHGEELVSRLDCVVELGGLKENCGKESTLKAFVFCGDVLSGRCTQLELQYSCLTFMRRTSDFMNF